MEITALVGESGSGKSYKAMSVARDNDIGYIIDDGILIKGTRLIAGKSAKREPTIVGAVKRAIFNNEDHKDEVINAIKKESPNKILIIGTSDKMVDKIANALNLPKISKTIYISDISNKEEIRIAKMSRYNQGKHVIPVPTFEIKKDFSGYFLDTLKMFRKKEGNTDVYEKTVMRPTFSYMGKYTISNRTLVQIIQHISDTTEGIYKPLKVKILNSDIGINIKIEIIFEYGCIINEIANRLQKRMKKDIENMTGMNVISIDVYAKSLHIRNS